MPHCVIDYSENLETVISPQNLIETVRLAVLESRFCT